MDSGVDYDSEAWIGVPILHFAIALAIGLLIGSERERSQSAQAGLRTFALISVFGALCAMLAEALESEWIVAAGIVAVAATMIGASHKLADGDPNTTTTIATLVTFGLGAMVWFGHPTLAAMLAVVTTVLLYFKPELERVSTAMSRQDWVSVLRFFVLSLIVLPVLPDRGFGPYGALNPFNVWLMVVLVSGISLAGYVALRFVGTGHGSLLLGVFGGLVSSTATTLVYGRAARDSEALRPLSASVIVIANTVLLVRIGVITGVVLPSLLPRIAVLLAAPLAIGLLGVVRNLRRDSHDDSLPLPEVANPVGLRTSLGFGLLYGVVLLAAAWLSDVAGRLGLYAAAFVSGATDLDAITLSTLRLVDIESIPAVQAVAAIGLALISNNLFKLGLLAYTADPDTRRKVGVVLGLMSFAIALGVAWVWE